MSLAFWLYFALGIILLVAIDVILGVGYGWIFLGGIWFAYLGIRVAEHYDV